MLGIRRMGRILNAQMRKLCTVRKGLNDTIEEEVLQWLSHEERMERDRITKRVYVGECAGSRSLGRPCKRWIDTMECKEKRFGC